MPEFDGAGSVSRSGMVLGNNFRHVTSIESEAELVPAGPMARPVMGSDWWMFYIGSIICMVLGFGGLSIMGMIWLHGVTGW